MARRIYLYKQVAIGNTLAALVYAKRCRCPVVWHAAMSPPCGGFLPPNVNTKNLKLFDEELPSNQYQVSHTRFDPFTGKYNMVGPYAPRLWSRIYMHLQLEGLILNYDGATIQLDNDKRIVYLKHRGHLVDDMEIHYAECAAVFCDSVTNANAASTVFLYCTEFLYKGSYQGLPLGVHDSKPYYYRSADPDTQLVHTIYGPAPSDGQSVVLLSYGPDKYNSWTVATDSIFLHARMKFERMMLEGELASAQDHQSWQYMNAAAIHQTRQEWPQNPPLDTASVRYDRRSAAELIMCTQNEIRHPKVFDENWYTRPPSSPFSGIGANSWHI